MTTCQKCYTSCRDEAKFCTRCGERLDQPSCKSSEPPPTAPISPVEIQYKKYEEPEFSMEKYTGESQLTINKPDLRKLEGKAKSIVRFFATVNGALTLCWLPFIDLLFLLPMLCYMVITIAKIFGQKLTMEMAKELIVTCFAGSMGFLASYACGKFIPIVGGILTAPIIFACTYAIGDVAIAYFSQEGKISKTTLTEIYNSSFQKSKKYYSGDLNEAKDSLKNIKEYLSPEEYEKIKNRLS